MNLHLTLQSTSINASKSDHARLRASLRIWLLVFMSALVVSGLTAIPLEWELNILVSLTQAVAVPTALAEWIAFVHTGLIQTYHAFPFLAYGTDWLAFAHIVIAIAFIGPFKDPVKNIWVIEFGMIACLLIIPTALIFGALRGIPFFWQLIDCSFGALGIIPLWYVHKLTKILEAQKASI